MNASIAEEFKKEGKKQYKAKNYVKAKAIYNEAIGKIMNHHKNYVQMNLPIMETVLPVISAWDC